MNHCINVPVGEEELTTLHICSYPDNIYMQVKVKDTVQYSYFLWHIVDELF